MRQIVLDTETTGLEPKEGHRIIEIGCVELENRRLTGNHFHVYINPDREVEEEALEVHGISNEFLADKPRFTDIVDEFINYIQGAQLIIHNAAFDVGFIDHELALAGKEARIDSLCSVLDTLLLARKKHPGQRNSLDALCKRYDIDNSHRELHGALLDSEILADVYLMMTGGQTSLGLDADTRLDQQGAGARSQFDRIAADYDLPVIIANGEELQAHEAKLDELAASGQCLWRAAD